MEKRLLNRYSCCWSGLKNQIEDKEKEILLLRANCDLSDKLSK